MSGPDLRDKIAAIIGLGQIGGSLALAFRKERLFKEIYGYDLDRNILKIAASRGLVDGAFSNLEKVVGEADLVILSIPVRQIISILPKVAKHLKPTALLCETGSTKLEILRAVMRLKIKNYIGIHPVAGTEKEGIKGWNADLFKNKIFTITPALNSPREGVAIVRKIINQIGAKVVPLSAERHDLIFSKTSHLPYLLAIGLSNLVFASEDKSASRNLLGGAFRDATRVALSSPVVMQDILISNRKNINRQISLFSSQLQKYQEYLKECNETGLRQTILKARKIRSALKFL